MSDRHAYLIMAHGNPDQLLKLISLLDDERNDIYLHIDAKADFPMERLKNATRKSDLTLIERIPVFWAEYSQVRVELNLLREAVNAGKSGGGYTYYHLLSGMDMPLKTQDEIHAFFRGKTTEFIAVCPGEGKYQLDHVRYAYPLLKIGCYRKSKALKALNEVLVLLQRLCGVKRSRRFEEKGWHFYDGWTWFSITGEFAGYILKNEPVIEEMFCRAKAPDEMFIQTIAMNSRFRDGIACIGDRVEGSKRLVDWERGRPYTFRKADLEELRSSPCMFARKFDERVDEEVIDSLFHQLKGMNGT